MDVSVIIPVKDDERLLEAVASVLRARTSARGLEVVVVSNGSARAFSETLRKLTDPRVRVINATGTVYTARNRAFEASSGEIIFFTDADCIVDHGWIEEGVRALGGGFDLVQGFSLSAHHTRTDRLIQARHEAHFGRMPPGTAVECDTRNLAVRRAVLSTVRFNERYRRVGDTELGLIAEAQGFRVGFAPAMLVSHAHDRSLDMFAAKQICHGWGAQRLMRERPGLPWHGGHLRLTARLAPRLRYLPGHWLLGRLHASAAILAARGIDRASWLPLGVAITLLAAADKVAGLAGHLMYRPGSQEPSPSALLRRRLPRD